MRKSSLGRRSSTQIPVRCPSLGEPSGQRTCSGQKKKRSGSLIRQPGFTQAQGQPRYRTGSEDRESYGSSRSTMGRLSSISCLPKGAALGTMTPMTPRENVYSNLPTGASSARPARSQSTGSNGRMSSFGGTKNARKDSRPINEKTFQQAAQMRVQQYFENNGSHVIGPGNSIRPMNTKLFVDMMDLLLKNFDSRIVITKSNYLEELPKMLKLFGYRSKVDRSWLLTVNTPHSWQHVIAVLSWLVDTTDCMNRVDSASMMYANNLEEPNTDDDENDLPINAKVMHYLIKGYKVFKDTSKSRETVNDMLHEQDLEFVKKEIIDERCTDEDFEILQREIDIIQSEVESESQQKDALLESLQLSRLKQNTLQNDCETMEAFIEESSKFVENTANKLASLCHEISTKQALLAKKQEELQRQHEKIKSQQISLEDKDTLNKEKQELMRNIQFHESSKREYEKAAFAKDIKFAEDQRKLDTSVVEYNKIVAENVVIDARLKNLEVKLVLLGKSEEALLAVDKCFKSLLKEYKDLLHTLDTTKEESEQILWNAEQNKKETEEEISKESALLEGVECDLEKQKESISKETEKLKDDLSRYEQMTKEIVDEMMHFDESKLEEKKLELQKIQHDYALMKKKAKTYFAEAKLIYIDAISKLQAPTEALNKICEDLEKTCRLYD